jgi:threonine/homoserine/homoserine lactone efflux protein
VRVIPLFAIAYVMGFLTAIPIGATQIEIAKRSLNNQVKAALMVVLGSVLSDVMYGFIAFFGVAPFLKNPTVIAIFELAGAVILWVLAYLTFKNSASARNFSLDSYALRNKHISFVTGFSLAVTNPMMIFWWLVLIKFIKDLNIIQTFTPTLSVLFLVFGGLGLASYLTTLTMILHWVKKFVSGNIMYRINIAMGIVLILISIYFLYGSLKILL